MTEEELCDLVEDFTDIELQDAMQYLHEVPATMSPERAIFYLEIEFEHEEEDCARLYNYFVGMNE